MSTELLGTITASPDSDATIAFDRPYRTDAADLWQAVTDPERLARWFAPVEGELRAGGEFTIRFDDGDIPRCTVESCDAPRGFVWLWPHGERTSRVTVSIAPEGDGSRLRLVHDRLSRAAAPEYGAGWQAYVRSLDAHLAGSEEGDWWGEFHAVKDAYAAEVALTQGRA